MAVKKPVVLYGGIPGQLKPGDTIEGEGPGTRDLHFTFNQFVPAATWNIVHNLGKFPSVSVVDSANDEVKGDVKYIDENSLTLLFSAPFSGTAHLN